MNGLPNTIDLDPLLGKELIQLCFGAFQLILNFDCDARIAVESICIYETASGTLTEIQNYSEGASQLCKIIGAQVSLAERDPDGGLILRFANGDCLRIKNSNHEYESFQIHIEQRIYVA